MTGWRDLLTASNGSCPIPIMTRNLDDGRNAMDPQIDLVADLNAEDDEGLGWSTLSDARNASRVRPGGMLAAGNRHAQAVVQVVAVDEDGQVHFTMLPGS